MVCGLVCGVLCGVWCVVCCVVCDVVCGVVGGLVGGVVGGGVGWWGGGVVVRWCGAQKHDSHGSPRLAFAVRMAGGREVS